MIFDCMEQKESLGQRLAVSVKRDIQKLNNLGYGKYVAFFTVALYFTAELEILKIVWPHIHGCMSDLALYVACLVTVNVTVTVTYNIAMYFIYTLKLPFFEQYRANKDTQWPWESSPREWSKIFWKTIKVNILNIFLVGPLLSYFDAALDYRIKMDMESIPSVGTMLWQICVFLLVQELLFYWVHRIMHHPKLYWIHKQHHEYNITMSLAPQYAHPIEHIFANNIPVGIAYKMLSKVYPVHIFTVIIWLTMRMVETCDGHCGYDWPWGQSQLLPFCGSGSYHYFHHKQNVGNYGAVLNLFDTLFDTNKDYYKYVKPEEKKND